MTEHRSRAAILADIRDAERDISYAEDDLADARVRLEDLQAELDALPPEGADEELFYARRDPRQQSLLPSLTAPKPHR